MRLLKCLLAMAALSVSVVSVGAQRVAVYQTTPDLKQALTKQPELRFEKGVTSGDAITVDDAKSYQSMEGFGAAMVDSSAWLLENLPSDQRDAAMRGLFSQKKGIGVSFIRVPLGASDLARNHYSYDDMPKGERDPGLKHFSIEHDRAYILPALQQAIKLNPQISIMVTPWAPPGWMKTTDSMTGGQLKLDAYADFAQYLVKSVEAYQQAGIPVKYLSLQNEPLYETKDYPGTLMKGDQQRDLIKGFVGPALKSAGLSTRILAYDHNWDHPEYPLTVLDDSDAAQYVAGAAFHCYGGDVSSQGPVHDKYPNKGMWLTECSGGTWQKGNLLAVTEKLVIESSRQWAKAVVLWGIALDEHGNPHAGGCGTCRPMVTVKDGGFSYTVDYYAIGQASRFVHVGAVRIDSTELNDAAKSGVETVAFKNPDGSVVLLALNNADAAREFSLNWHGRSAKAVIAPGAVETFVWK